MPSMHVQAHHGVRRVGVSGSHNARHHGRHDGAPRRPALRADELRSLLLAPDGPLARVEIVDVTESTNTDLAADLRADPASWPDASVLVAEHQAGGRGRAGRTWETPAGTSLTCSFVVRPADPGRVARLDRAARRPRRGQRAARHRGRPGGAEVAQRPARPGRHRGRGLGPGPQDRRHPRRGGRRCPTAVRRPSSSGSGSTSARRADELPVPSATSLALAGAQHVDREGMLVALVDAQLEVARRWRDSGGDARGSGLADEVARGLRHARDRGAGRAAGRRRSSSGLAARLDDDGALVVLDDAGAEHRVLAGDVRHVRAAG